MAEKSSSEMSPLRQLTGVAGVLGIIVTLAFFYGQVNRNGTHDTGSQSSSGPTATRVQVPPQDVTAEMTLIAKPNTAENPDSGDLTVLKGRPGWALCTDVPPGAQMWFKDRANRWVAELPADGAVKDWGFRSVSGKDETVEYNFDRSPKCDTPVPMT